MTINRLTAKLSMETKVPALPTNPEDLTRALLGRTYIMSFCFKK
jgi:hypothetical protein